MVSILRSALVAVAVVSLAGIAGAQNAISAKAGMINVADGDVFVIDAKGGEPRRIEPKASEFIDIKEGQTLKTAEGRAEVLLTPGSFLRLGEESSFRLVSSRLSGVRVEMLAGSALIDISELLDGNEVTVTLKDSTVTLVKAGLYRFDAEPARVRTFMGEAIAEYAGQKSTLKGGRELSAASGAWALAKFDTKDSDSLFRWAKRRSGYIAMANVSAARQATPANGFRGGSWFFNPYFGFATYVPWSDTLRNPFGYYYYTPSTVMTVYYPPRPAPSIGGGGLGMGGGYSAGMAARSSSSSSYTPSAGISASAPSAPSAPSGAGSAGSRGGDGGGAASSGGGGARGGRGN